jgi:GNAT superfamily N-acetyltransferase
VHQIEKRRADGYVVSTDRRRLDLDAMHAYLCTSYWAEGIPRQVLARAVEHSLCFGLFAPDGSQVGFARAVTDRAVFAHLADVYVLDAHRGKGLGVWLVETMLAHPDLQGLRGISLATVDAHGLYERFGFGPPTDSSRLMAKGASPEELYGGDA